MGQGRKEVVSYGGTGHWAGHYLWHDEGPDDAPDQHPQPWFCDDNLR
jgi:hypothetical protein